MFIMDLESRENQIFLAVVACVVWTTLSVVFESMFTFKAVSTKVDHDIKNRFVSIVHGLLLLILAAYNIFHDQPSFTDKNSEIQLFLMLVSMGYFIYDYAACYYYGIADRALAIHHALAIFGYLVAIHYDTSTLAMCGMFYGETSNSFMHFRVILREFGKRYTKLHEVFDVLYMMTYLIARGVFMTKVNYDTLFISGIPMFLRIACIGLWVQSLLFAKEMIFILQRKNKQFQERRKKSIHYFWFTENPEIKNLSYTRKEKKEAVF
jgi:hypothetical protein